MKKKRIRIVIVIVVVVLAAILFFTWKNSEMTEKKSGILEEIYGYSGYSRTISEEEYEFYQYFVERDLSGEVSEETLKELVEAYAGEVNATFYLGNKLGFCEPYSYDALKLRMDQENALRKTKQENGEVIYGVQQFQSLSIYFQYSLDQVQTAICGYLEQNADQEILKMAEEYYEEHRESFQSIAEIVYEQTINGVTETLSADAEMLNFYGKSDKGLADFLGCAQVGDVYEDSYNDQERTIVLKDVTYTAAEYENSKNMALYSFVKEELYAAVISRVAQNNPVAFE